METKAKNTERKTKEQTALEDLKEVKEVLDKHGVEFWLDCGVLLGAIREQRFIPWDGDIDLAIWEKDIKKTVSACRELQKKGFRIILYRSGVGLKRSVSPAPIALLFCHLINGNATIKWGAYKTSRFFQRFWNIFFWTFSTPYYGKISPKGISGVKNFIRLILANISYAIPHFVKKWAAKVELRYGQKYLSIIPAHHFTNLSTVKFYGMEFRVPSKTEEYLTYRYGKDWRVPKRNWVGAEQDGTIFENDGTIFKNI